LRPARSGAGARVALRALAIGLIALVALAGGYYSWLRDSSLVAVTEVDVKGLSGPERERIEGRLVRAAKRMTTLHVDQAKLEAAVASEPTVVSVSASADFPHGLTVDVRERPPTAFASTGGKEVALAADGTLLAGVPVPEGAPRIRVDELPKGNRLAGEPLDQAVVVGAVPEPLRPLIEGVSYSRDFGVEVQMRGGIPIRFGTAGRAADKWTAAAAVLADPKLESASHIDVRVPERPAAGGAAS
jgi:cell division protein FtsQ